MSKPLLTTKFYCPRPRLNLVPRQRLFKQLDAGLYQADGFARKLTLVSAPAGYGKTTLIADWLTSKKEANQPDRKNQPLSQELDDAAFRNFQTPWVAWLSLEAAENDPARFLAYLVASFRQANENIVVGDLSSLQSSQIPSELILTKLINAIAAIDTLIIFALDDYHVISTPAVHKQLTFLLDHLPPQIHLVIMTREDPLLPVARLRARGEVLEIRQNNLRFTRDEMVHFLDHVMGLDLSTNEIGALERRTEGWIAGLQLAALSMQGREDVSGFIQAFTGSSRFILDYLIEEVFERQSPEVKHFLLKTSILEHLTAPLCDVVVETTRSQELLESLEQANLFILPLDLSRGWYRYHHLFSELLYHRLRSQQPDVEVVLHQRASHWFETEGMIPEAIQHAQAAKDWGRAGNLIQRINSDYLKRGEALTLIHWYQSFPEEVLWSNPRLCFDYCWPLLVTGQYYQAQPILTHLEKVAADIPTFLGEIYAAQAYLERGLGNHECMIKRSQLALAYLSEDSLISRSIVNLNLGLAYWHMGQMKSAEDYLKQALKTSQSTENLYAVMAAIIFLGRVFAVRGQLYQAEEYFKEAITKGKDIPINALAYMDLAALHYEWNLLDQGEEYLQKALKLSQQSKNDEFLVGCLIFNSRLRIAQGDVEGAEEVLEQAKTFVRQGKIPEPMAKRVDAAEVYYLDQISAAPETWASRVSSKYDSHSFYRFIGVTKARTLPAPDARAYLAELGRTAQENDWTYALIMIRALQATLAETQQGGLEYLSEAFHLGRDSGFIRSFLEAGEPIIPLLKGAIRKDIFPDYAEKILAAMGHWVKWEKTSLDSLVEAPTERELEVLRLVTQGLSNREIAAELVISTGTAKSHIHNLCGKLGVRNRTEAAMKAIELGLV